MPAQSKPELAKIGMIGLAVMGENLALNIARNGFPIAVFNRDTSKVDKFLHRAEGKQVIGAYTIEDFVKSLEKPRKIILLVKAGAPVDDVLSHLKPLLEPGDIVIDGGNSFFEDTRRRETEMKAAGGNRNAYEQIRPIWEAIAAKVDDGPCVTYIGPDGAGHFVKMVHNGIEYGD